MNNRIFNYVEGLFEEIPNSKKARDLKSELIANLDDRYEDYIREGKSPNESFQLTISSLGNIDQLLEEVQPSSDFIQDKNKYLKRNALITGISVALYILSGAVLILMGILSDRLDIEFLSEIGFIGTIVIVAIATALLIYINMSTPQEYKVKTAVEEEKTTKENLYSSIFWSITTIIFLVMMFIFRLNNSWIIWVFAGISWSIISTIIKLKGTK